jgi:PAS domain S-box-containing protein
MIMKTITMKPFSSEGPLIKADYSGNYRELEMFSEQGKSETSANTDPHTEPQNARLSYSRLQEAKSRLDLVMKAGQVGFWDLNLKTGQAELGDITFEMLGYSREDIKPTLDTWNSLLHPDDREAATAKFKELIEGKTQSYESEYRLKTRTNEWIWILSRGNVVARDELGKPLRIAGAHLDITAKKCVDKSLELSEKRFRAIFDSAGVGIALVDGQGRYLQVNNSFADMMGYSPDELHSKPCLDLIGANNRADTQRLLGELIQGRSRQVCRENCFIRKDGGLFWGYQTISELRNSDDQLEGFIEVVEDITERKKSQELILYKERLRAFSELAGGVTHNFNNLLQMVMSGAQLAAEHLAAGRTKQAEYKLIKLVESSRFGAETVRRLQNFGGLQNDRDEGIFDLSEVTKQAAEMSKTLGRRPDATGPESIEFILDLEGECFVRGRNYELFEVVVNLIKNAVEACPEGGKVRIKLYKDNDHVKLSVEDNGVGIPKSFINRIFDSFWSAKGMNGAGMGLAVSMAIVRRHKGDMTVESEEGKGATFYITLPGVEPEDSDLTDNSAQIQETPLSMKILLIDDMVPLLDMMGDALVECGHEVHMANSGAEGLEILTTHEVDAIICDLAMPGIPGTDVAIRAREICRDQNRTPPVFVLMTGGAYSKHDEELQKPSINAILNKPVDIYHALETIRNEMKAQSQAAIY